MESYYDKDWQVYDKDYGYDKFEYDIQLNNGDYVYNCYPNAGKFNSFNNKTDGKQYDEGRIYRIRLSEKPILEIND